MPAWWPLLEWDPEFLQGGKVCRGKEKDLVGLEPKLCLFVWHCLTLWHMGFSSKCSCYCVSISCSFLCCLVWHNSSFVWLHRTTTPRKEGVETVRDHQCAAESHDFILSENKRKPYWWLRNITLHFQFPELFALILRHRLTSSPSGWHRRRRVLRHLVVGPAV